MSKTWYENLAVTDIDSVIFDIREAQFLQLAYENTLCNTETGKKVLCHLDTMIRNLVEDPDTPPEAKLMAYKILNAIVNNCGIIHDLTYIKAITGTARQFKIEQETETE